MPQQKKEFWHKLQPIMFSAQQWPFHVGTDDLYQNLFWQPVRDHPLQLLPCTTDYSQLALRSYLGFEGWLG